MVDVIEHEWVCLVLNVNKQRRLNYVSFWFAAAGGQQTLWVIRISLNSVAAAEEEEETSSWIAAVAATTATDAVVFRDNTQTISKWD